MAVGYKWVVGFVDSDLDSTLEPNLVDFEVLADFDFLSYYYYRYYNSHFYDHLSPIDISAKILKFEKMLKKIFQKKIFFLKISRLFLEFLPEYFH